MTNPSRVQIARLHLAKIRQTLTGQSCPEPVEAACPEPGRGSGLVRQEPPLEPARVSRRAELAAAIEQARTTPKDPDEAARAERLMALLRREGTP
jgi:hypothetical protein